VLLGIKCPEVDVHINLYWRTAQMTDNAEKVSRIWDMYVMYLNHGPDSKPMSFDDWLAKEQLYKYSFLPTLDEE
jgi:hypothetical protein